MVFRQTMGRFDIAHYIEQSKKPSRDRSEDAPDNSIHFLEVYWDVFWGTTETEILIKAEFHGRGNIRQGSDVFPTAYGVDFTPINNLLDYPLSLNNEFVISRRNDDNLTHNILFEGTKEWTLYDVLHAILNEITFHGTPADAIAKGAELSQIVANAKAKDLA